MDHTHINKGKLVDICTHLAQFWMSRKVCIPGIVHNNELLPILVKHNAPLFQQLSSSLDPAIGLLCKQGKYLQCGQTSISVCIGTSQFASYSWLLSRTKQAANTAHIREKKIFIQLFWIANFKAEFHVACSNKQAGGKKTTRRAIGFWSNALAWSWKYFFDI